MARERSTIELFFKALGHRDVQAALRSIAEDAARADRAASQIGKSATNSDLGRKLRSTFQSATREAAVLTREVGRLETLGAKGKLDTEGFKDLARAQREVRSALQGVYSVRKNQKGVLDPEEIRNTARLRSELERLQGRARAVVNAPPAPLPDPSIAARARAQQELRDRAARAKTDQAFLASEVRRLGQLGSQGALTGKDLAGVKALRSEIARVALEYRSIKRTGPGLINPNEIVDVQRLQDALRRLGQTSRQIANPPAVDPSIRANQILADQLRARLARAKQDQTYVAGELRRLTQLGAQGGLTAKDVDSVKALRSELARVALEYRAIRRNGPGIINPEEIKDANRLREALSRLSQSSRGISNATADPIAAKAQQLRDLIQRLRAEQAAISKEISRLTKVGENNALTSTDTMRLQRLRGELAAVGNQLRSVKRDGTGIISADELRNVRRMTEEFQRLALAARQVKNRPTDPNVALGAQIRADLARAKVDQAYIRKQIGQLGQVSKDRRFTTDERQFLAQLRTEYAALGSEITRLNTIGLHILSPTELKDVQRLRREYAELQKQIEAVRNRPIFSAATVSPTVRGFISAVRNDIGGLGSLLASVGQRGFTGMVSGAKLLGSTALSAVTNVGGLVPAFNFVKGAITGVFGVMRNFGFQILSATFAAAALVRTFQGLFESNAKLEGTVTALRSLNGEIDKANGRAKFAYDNDSFDANGGGKVGGLMDINGGQAVRTANDLRYLNKVAYDHGLTISDLAGGYVKLKAATQGTSVASQDLQLLFKGLTDANTVLGGTSDNANRAIIALSQMASKGQVYSEELKGQLSEALPGAVGLAARAYGLSVKDFNKQVADGLVDSATFIKKFSVQLDKEFGLAAMSMANTSRVAFGRLKSAFETARVAIASGKLDESIVRVYAAITRVLNTMVANGAFSRFGANLAKTIDTLGARLEKAADGSYDFERVLNGLSKTFSYVVDAGMGFFDLLVSIKNGIGETLQAIVGADTKIPTLGDGFRALGRTIVSLKDTFISGDFSDNRFVNFLAAIASAFTEFTRLMFSRATGGKDVFQSLGDSIQYAAYWLGQLAYAFRALRTGSIEAGTDETGLGILTELILADQKIREMKTSLRGLGALVTGKDAPENASDGMKRAFGYRGALGNLVTGGKNVDSTDENAPYKAEDLDTLFKLRDIIRSLVGYVVENREAFAAAGAGIVAGLKGIQDAILIITNGLNAVGLDTNVAYMAGLFLVLAKIPGVSFLATKGLAALWGGIGTGTASLATRFGGVAVAMTALTAALGVLTVYIYKRYGNQIKGGFDNLMSELLSGGGLFKNSASEWFREGYEGRAGLDALATSMQANGNKGYQRFVEQGYDPYKAAQLAQYATLGMDPSGIGLSDSQKAAAEEYARTLADQTEKARIAALRERDAGDATIYGDGVAGGQRDEGREKQPIVLDLTAFGLGRYTGDMDSSDVSEIERVASQRAGRTPAWNGAGE